MSQQDSNIKTYLGNSNLKGVGCQLSYTNHQISEIIRCSLDPIYFIKTYVQIVHVDHGLVPFELYPFQEKLVKTAHTNRFIICKMPRQSGKSTTFVAYFLWYLIFNDNVNCALLANKGGTAREILSRLQLAYEHLPFWLQQGIVIWNKGNIELENGSKILAAATSGPAVRGGSFNLIFLDEFAHIHNNLAEEFFTSVYPTISSGKTTKVFIVSTPRGMNMFYKMWQDAVEGKSNYIPIDIHWSEVPGRDDKWKEETIKNTSPEQFSQEFDTEFLGSTSTLISATKLKTLLWRKPIHESDGLDIYEMPVKGNQYVLTVDTAEGKGMDYHAFVVFDVTHYPYKMVAKFKNRTLHYMLYPNVIYKVAKEYNDAAVLVEILATGMQVADNLHFDLEYENLITVSVKGRNGQIVGGGFQKNSQRGVKTSKAVKKMGCLNLKSLIESDKLIISDFETITELSTFVSDGMTFNAEEGCFDDLVTCLWLFGWLVSQKYFRESVDRDIRIKMEQDHMKQVESDILPFFIDAMGGSAEEESFVDSNGDRWTVVT